MDFYSFCLILEGRWPDVYDTIGGGKSSFDLYAIRGNEGVLGEDGETWVLSQTPETWKTFGTEGEAWGYILGRYKDKADWAERGGEMPFYVGRYTVDRGRLQRVRLMDKYEIDPKF